MNRLVLGTTLFLLMNSVLLKVSSAEVVHFAAAEWCPYTCANKSGEGIVSDRVRNILTKHGFELRISFVPWKRAVYLAESGQVDGLLTGVEKEAPRLQFTSTPTMGYRSCLFSIDDEEKLSDLKEVEGKNIGIRNGYSYGKRIDKFLAENKGENVVINGEIKLNRLKKLFSAGRIDYIAEDENVAKYLFKGALKPVYCGEMNPFFIGFNRSIENQEKLIKILNKELKLKAN